MTSVLTGVGAIISAAHRSRDGNMHGHTWEVIAWFESGRCGVELQRELEQYLSIFDHSILGDDMAWGEALCVAIQKGLGCVEVEVRRPLERIYAKTCVARGIVRKAEGCDGRHNSPRTSPKGQGRSAPVSRHG